MKNIKLQCIFIYLIFFELSVFSQILKPGFDKEEYKNLMLISIRSVKNEDYSNSFPQPEKFKMIYQSKDLTLDNSWDLWLDDKGVAVISLRGTTEKPESWLENFYAAMVPAKGELKLSENETFKYKLSENEKAGVHVGWLVGMAFLSKEIVPKVDSLSKNGIKNFLIIGHSQGGAIAYLLTSYLYNLQKTNQIADDVRFKTYCSAAPKPGNLYYAYDFESQTQNGWAFNVVNAFDWVPELPFSIQTLNDLNNTNPFKHAEKIINNQKLPNRVVLKHIYKKLDSPTKEAQKNYQKYLGEMASKLVVKKIPGLEVPPYLPSNHYTRAGNFIVLMPNEIYQKTFTEKSSEIFTHHFHKPYLFLLDFLDLK